MAIDRLRMVLRDGLVKALNDDRSDIVAKITTDSFGLLGVAVKRGRLTSLELESSKSYLLADMMVVAGLLEQGGDKLHPYHYIITEKGRAVYSD